MPSPFAGKVKCRESQINLAAAVGNCREVSALELGTTLPIRALLRNMIRFMANIR